MAAVLRDEQADVVVLYDWHGVYGHPDHVQVHRVGHRGRRSGGAHPSGSRRRSTGTPPGRAWPRWSAQRCRASRTSTRPGPADDGNPFGTPEAEIDLAVDVSRVRVGEAGRDRLPRQPGDRHRHVPRHARGGVRPGLQHRVVHRARAPAPDSARDGCWTGSPPDGARPSRAPRARRGGLGPGSGSGPRRDRRGPGPPGGRAARPTRRGGRPAHRHQPVAQVPADGGAAGPAVGRDARRSRTRSPRSRRRSGCRWPTASSGCGRPWRGTWTELGDRYVGVPRRRRLRSSPPAPRTRSSSPTSSPSTPCSAPASGTIALVIRRLDNTSITVVDVDAGTIRLVEPGHEADTLIR